MQQAELIERIKNSKENEMQLFLLITIPVLRFRILQILSVTLSALAREAVRQTADVIVFAVSILWEKALQFSVGQNSPLAGN